MMAVFAQQSLLNYSVQNSRISLLIHCQISSFPNATVSEYGTIHNNAVDAIKAEIFVRGPVAASINGKPLHTYQGGVFNDTDASNRTTHIVTIVGWGIDKQTGIEYWRARNSWGQYWGESLGFFRVSPIGKNVLGIESEVVWATPGSWTEQNYPCFEDGSNCINLPSVQHYVDPFRDKDAVQKRFVMAERVYNQHDDGLLV